MKDDPLVNWLVHHLWSDHQIPLDVQEGRTYDNLSGYHDALHGPGEPSMDLRLTSEHPGYADALQRHKDAIRNLIGYRVEKAAEGNRS